MHMQSVEKHIAKKADARPNGAALADLPLIEDMSLAELHALRGRLGIRQAELCREALIDPSTYSRWMRWLRGEDGGTCPQPRSVEAVRRVLKRRIERFA